MSPFSPVYPEPLRVIGYFTSWGAARNGYTAAMIPGERLTAVNYAFSNISSEGEVILGNPEADVERFYPAQDSGDGVADDPGGLHGSFNQLLKLKKKYPHLIVLISIGGWTWSDNFSDAALTADSRKKFAESCIELYFQKYAGVFDGVDIDWEFPVSGGLKTGRPEDRQNFTLLLAELRRQLDARGEMDSRRYLLTLAAPASPSVYVHIELERIAGYLDWINLMTYDFHGAFDPVTNFNAPLYKSADDPAPDPLARESYNLDAAVRAYLRAGIPPGKLVIGIPFYGRAWQGVPAGNNGLYQRATGPGPGTWEPGVLDYADIARNHLPGSIRSWHAQAKVPWLYNPATGVMITYDDPESISLKAEYARDHALGGVMFWELSNDGGILLDAIYQRLKKPTAPPTA